MKATYSNGIITVDINDKLLEASDAGFVDGLEQGKTEGYAQGYEEGYADGLNYEPEPVPEPEPEPTPTPGGNPLDLPLYDPSRIEYLGGFLLPNGGGDIGGQRHEGFKWAPMGHGGIAYNPTNNSLFLTGSTLNNNQFDSVIAEVSIPTNLAQSGNPGSYETAQLIQGFSIACGQVGKQRQVNTSGAGSGSPITGMVVDGDRIIMTATAFYLNSATNRSVFIRSTDLNDDTVEGPFGVTSLNQRIVGNGVGGLLPENWAEHYGHRVMLGGGGNISTMNTGCYGPGFHLFDPDSKQGRNLCYYTPIDTGVPGWAWTTPRGDTSAIWNGLSTHRGTVILPDSRTFMAYGHGGSDAFYDSGGAITGESQGTKGTGDLGRDRFYLYDARDLDGSNPRNSVRPYAVFDMNFCLNNTMNQWLNESKTVRCLTFDPVNRLAYVHERNVGIHVLKFN